MELEMTPKTRFIAVLVLLGPEFENSNQFDSFVRQFLNKMSHNEIQNESLNCVLNYGQTEENIKKIIDRDGIVDFLREFLIPTIEKVFITINRKKLIELQ